EGLFVSVCVMFSLLLCFLGLLLLCFDYVFVSSRIANAGLTASELQIRRTGEKACKCFHSWLFFD
ncbi:MAG: hypothetical protein IKZ55_07510, partial [Bacteroidales bacterium]|nr:hypothetical protein [Bacteroidales bacterium]